MLYCTKIDCFFDEQSEWVTDFRAARVYTDVGIVARASENYADAVIVPFDVSFDIKSFVKTEKLRSLNNQLMSANSEASKAAAKVLELKQEIKKLVNADVPDPDLETLFDPTTMYADARER